MNVDSPLESIKSDIAIEFENQKQAKIIYRQTIKGLKTYNQRYIKNIQSEIY